MEKLLPLILIIVSAALTVVADMFLKKSRGTNRRGIETGFVLYALVAIPSAFAYKYIQFGSYYLLWEVLTSATAIAVGTFYFREKFTFWRAMTIIFALATIFVTYQA